MSNQVATIEISLNGSRHEYSRHIFGHFIEHFHRQVYGGIFEPGSPLSDESGFRIDVLDALRELRVPVVRWPGGSFVSAYHWLDAVGENRVPVYDRAWRVTDPNTFGTDEFLRWCELLGAEPYLVTNAGTGSIEEMADWVEYTNRPAGSKWADLRVANGRVEPYGVKFWSIGNENYAKWELARKSSEEWPAFVKEAAKIILRTDESVSLLAAAIERIDWVGPMMEAAGNHLSYMSIHGYWDDLAERNEPSTYLQAMARTADPENRIFLARSLLEASGQKHIKVAFDEWNLRGWHHPEGTSEAAIAARDLNDDNSTYTMADALFSASFLNSCLRNSDVVGMANISPSVNARGPLFAHPGGIVKRTTFHVMSMYANLLGPQVANTRVTSEDLITGAGNVPLVDAVATVHDDGSLAIVLVNKSETREVPVAVNVAGAAIDGLHPAVVLTGEYANSYNDVDNPHAVVPEERDIAFDDGTVLVPPHTVMVVTVRRATAG